MSDLWQTAGYRGALTFGIDCLADAKDIHLENVVVCDAFGLPELAVATLLDVAAEQQITVDLLSPA